MAAKHLETSCSAGLGKLRIITHKYTLRPTQNPDIAKVKAGSPDSNQCAYEVSRTRQVKHRRTMFLLLTIQPVTACAPYQHS
jgi:hypothetical protein